MECEKLLRLFITLSKLSKLSRTLLKVSIVAFLSSNSLEVSVSNRIKSKKHCLKRRVVK